MSKVQSELLHPDAPLFIGGKFVPSGGGRFIDTFDPSTGRKRYSLPAASAEGVDLAVASARRAFTEDWRAAPPSFRKDVLSRFSELIAVEARALDALDAGDMGKPVSLVMANGAMASALVRFYAEAIDKLTSDVYSSDQKSFVCQRRVARGVVGAISPWNFPTVNAIRKVGPALAAGNAVVLKPSEIASSSALRIAELALNAGLPPGVLNVVLGDEATGRALALHNNVDMVSFTGSTAVGKKILQYSGESNLKVVMAECGGKSPHILFDDGVDLLGAIKSIIGFLLTNQGQICTVGSRLLVPRSLQDYVIQLVRPQFEAVVIGNAMTAATTFGPLGSARQCARVLDYIATAERDGARLALGGNQVLREAGGHFVEPTLFVDVAPGSRLAQEEIFGPVLAVIPFDDEEHAISIANSTPYGLAAYVWTADLSRAMRLANALYSSVRINAVPPSGEGAGHAYSSEPAGESGIGIETGVAGMESYMRRQGIWISHG